jgi:hypothetical protein
MMWGVTLVFAAMSLLCALPSCIPAVGADPLIITVARDGSDEPVCLEGKIACNTFKYACRVNGNGSDVTIVITYPQEYHEEYIEIGLNVRNMKLLGQVEDGYTFTCTTLQKLVGHVNLIWVISVAPASRHMRVNTMLTRNHQILLHTCIVA